MNIPRAAGDLAGRSPGAQRLSKVSFKGSINHNLLGVIPGSKKGEGFGFLERGERIKCQLDARTWIYERTPTRMYKLELGNCGRRGNCHLASLTYHNLDEGGVSTGRAREVSQRASSMRNSVCS